MWIFMSNSFLSIVAPTPGSEAAANDHLIVRARAKGDIEAVFPNAKVAKSRGGQSDYAFRATIARAEVAEVMARQVTEITAPNFKDSVHQGDRRVAYERVWAVMNDFQTDRGNPGKYGLPINLHDDPAFDDYLRPGRRFHRRKY